MKEGVHTFDAEAPVIAAQSAATSFVSVLQKDHADGRALIAEARQVLDTFSGGPDSSLIARMADVIARLMLPPRRPQATFAGPSGAPVERIDFDAPAQWAVLYQSGWGEIGGPWPDVHGIYDNEEDARAFLRWCGHEGYHICRARRRLPLTVRSETTITGDGPAGGTNQ